MDKINHPDHYTHGGIECIDAIEAATHDLSGIEAVCTANAIKYLWRWKLKGGAEDLKKAKWYIDRLLQTLQTTSETMQAGAILQSYEEKSAERSCRVCGGTTYGGVVCPNCLDDRTLTEDE